LRTEAGVLDTLITIVAACEREDGSREKAGRAAVDFVVHVQSEARSDSAVAAALLRAVRWLSGGDTAASKSVTNIAALAEHGAEEFVLTILSEHFTNAAVQSWGCGALLALARVSNVKDSILSKGGVLRVIEAMTLHNTSVEVQRHGCWALAILGHSNRQEVLWKLERATVAMKGFELNAGVQGKCCALLTQLAIDEPVAVVNASGQLLALSALDAHLNVSAVQSACLFALSNLAGHEVVSAAVFRSGVLPRVLAAMDRLANDTVVLQNGLNALYNLGVLDSSENVIVASGGLERDGCPRVFGHFASVRLSCTEQSVCFWRG
jgi:hypothetical protein